MARGTRGQDDPNAEMLRAMRDMMESQRDIFQVQREYNLLMKERMDRREEVGQLAPGAPPPPPLPHRPGSVTDFRRLQPGTFAGTETPLIAEQWLMKTEQLLKAARVPEDERVDVMGIQLTDLAHIWWTNETERLGPGPIYWDVFATAFLEKFFPSTARYEMERRFITLVQGNRTVDEYAAEFTRLSRFAPAHVATEEKRAEKFKMGLDFSILEHVVSLPRENFDGVLKAARQQESVQRRRRAVQRSHQPGNSSSSTPARTFPGGPIRRPPQAPANRPQPYAPAPARNAPARDVQVRDSC